MAHCPICGSDFLALEQIVRCETCETPHHETCWDYSNSKEDELVGVFSRNELKNCGVYSCEGRHAVEGVYELQQDEIQIDSTVFIPGEICALKNYLVEHGHRYRQESMNLILDNVGMPYHEKKFFMRQIQFYSSNVSRSWFAATVQGFLLGVGVASLIYVICAPKTNGESVKAGFLAGGGGLFVGISLRKMRQRSSLKKFDGYCGKLEKELRLYRKAGKDCEVLIIEDDDSEG